MKTNQGWYSAKPANAGQSGLKVTKPASTLEPFKGLPGATQRFLLEMTKARNPAKPASTGSEWPNGLPSQSKQDQGPRLPTTNL